MSVNPVRSGPGRPRKYGRSSRAVTLTLPEDVLGRLNTIDADVGRAIVTLVERDGPSRPKATRQAELSSYGSHAVIVVTPGKVLKRLAGVQLVPVGNGRALISLEPSQSIPQLELDIRDAIEKTPANSPEQKTLEAIAEILREGRLSGKVTVEGRTIIVLKAKRQRRSR